MLEFDDSPGTPAQEVGLRYTTEDKSLVEDPGTISTLEKVRAAQDTPVALDLSHPTEGYVKFAHGTVSQAGEMAVVEFVVREMDHAGYEKDQNSGANPTPRPKDYMGDVGTVEAIRMGNGDWWVGGTADKYSPKAQEKTSAELRQEGADLAKEVIASLNNSLAEESSE